MFKWLKGCILETVKLAQGVKRIQSTNSYIKLDWVMNKSLCVKNVGIKNMANTNQHAGERGEPIGLTSRIGFSHPDSPSNASRCSWCGNYDVCMCFGF